MKKISSILMLCIIIGGCVSDNSFFPRKREIKNENLIDKNIEKRIVEFIFYALPDEINVVLSDLNPSHMQALHFGRRDDLISKIEDNYGGNEPCPLDVKKIVSKENFYEAMKSAQLTMISEAHHKSVDRNIIYKIANLYEKEEVVFYGAETFTPNILEYNPVSNFKADYGWYSNDPHFARAVKKLTTFQKLFAYEYKGDLRGKSKEERFILRENGQFNNLTSQVNLSDIRNRLVLHTGRIHASEVNENPNEKTLAMLIKEKIGIDPITVIQASCSNVTSTQYLKGFNIPNRRYDFAVVHPYQKVSLSDLPQKWRMSSKLQIMEIPEKITDIEGLKVLEVRSIDQLYDDVPIDRLILWDGEKGNVIVPEKGTFKITVFLKNDNSTTEYYFN